MTNGAREEIEKVARDLCPAIHDETGKCRPGPGCLCRRITQDILTQVEKARAEERERCAKIAKEYGSKVNKDAWSITHTMAGERISEAIRNKPEKDL